MHIYLYAKRLIANISAALLLVNTSYGQNILVQPYLQLATPTSIVIMWETDVNAEGKVLYGLTSDLGSFSQGTSITTLGSTQLHSATLTGLTPGTFYYYKAITGSWQSSVYDFVTPPDRNSEAPLNIVLMSDMQKDGGNPNVFSNLINTSLLPYIDTAYGSPLSENLQMALLPGDLVDNGSSYNQWKNDFFIPGQALWRSVPFYPAIGNHEVNSQNYFNYYTLPENGTPGYLEHWYYHDYSNVRVISLNSNSPYRIQAQLDWLEDILELSCADTLIDFVFAEMHHPFKSELWTPGETNYTGDIVALMEAFSEECGKPTIHFFGHTHAYSRGQSRDHDHLWVNVATSGGNIDYWGEFDNEDYDEFIISEDEYGFVMVEVTAGADPHFVLKRLSFGDQFNPGGSTQTDIVTIRKNNTPPFTPYPLFPGVMDTVSAACFTIKADGFFDPDGDEHGSSHWQISTDSTTFLNPAYESWKQYANWYNEINLQEGDELTDEEITNLEGNETYWWRVRYRDKSLEWSPWSLPTRFTTRSIDTLTTNLIINAGAENGITSWTTTIGVIESLSAGECSGISPFQGSKYFAVGALCVEHPFASAYQDHDVSPYGTQINAGDVLAHFGAYMANWQNSDEPSMALVFLDEDNVVISSTDTLRHMQSAWTLKQNTTPVPAGTITIRSTLMGTRTAGNDNDSYIDNVFCRLISGDVVCSTYAAPGPANNRIYVNQNAVAFPDGESWTTAYRTPGDALKQSNADTSIHEIWIAEGVYPVSSLTNRDTFFGIEQGVSIFGGFAGVETLTSQRNLNEHVTVLSGEIGDTSILSDNAFHVLMMDSTMDTILVDGIHICYGYADITGNTTGAGIFISADNDSPIYIRQCHIDGNVAIEGSSLHNQAITVIEESTITNVVIEGISGSSILNSGAGANLTLINTTITQQCINCPEVIKNTSGAQLKLEQSVIIEKE